MTHLLLSTPVVLKSGIIRYRRRDIVMVLIEKKRQPFYRSTGESSGMPGQWLPFDGIKHPNTPYEWFDKKAYVLDPEQPWNKYGFGELYRYGTQLNWEISQALGKLNLPEGVEVSTGMDVNLFLGVAQKYDSDAFKRMAKGRWKDTWNHAGK